MTLVHSFNLGRLRCHGLDAGLQRLDGGAMFGIVPRPLWAKRAVPDERNRIPLALRCLLIEHPAGLTLVDSGIGNKEDAKFRAIYGVENEGAEGQTRLELAIARAGFSPDEVRWVINTHLHFDHAGGNTWIERDAAGTPVGGPRLSFPNATYVVQAGELEFARHANERTRASYLAPSFEPIAEAGRWRLLQGEEEILPGVAARLTPGHVPHHQSLLIRDGADTLLYLGDVMPTSQHLPLPWIMGYDLEPLRTLESKRQLIRAALDGGWRLFFEHDPEVVMARLDGGGGGVALAEVTRASGAAG